jgi:hypothetical protein
MALALKIHVTAVKMQIQQDILRWEKHKLEEMCFAPLSDPMNEHGSVSVSINKNLP